MASLTVQIDTPVLREADARRPAVVPDGARFAVWVVAAVAIAATLTLPFLVVDTPAVLDYPNHLARFYILAHPHDPILSRMYAPHWRVLPNLGMDILGAQLLRLVSPSVGGRLLLALSLLAPVGGVLVYHRIVFRRFSYWPLAAALAAYNGVFFLGFMNFLLGIGLGLMAAGGWIGLRRRGDYWRAGLMGGMASAVLFLCHIFGVAYFALLIGSWELSRLDEARRGGALQARTIVRTTALIALALAPAAALYLASPMASATSLGPWEGSSKLWALFTPFMIYSRPLTLLTGAAVFATVILAWRTATIGAGVRTALVVLAALYVAAPAEFKGGTFIDIRLALMAGLLLCAGLDPPLPRPRVGLIIAVTFGGLLLLRSACVAAAWIDHREDLAEVRAAIAPVAPGARVLVARGDASGRTDVRPAGRAIPGLYRLDGHLGSLLVIERHAFWPLLFADPSQQPLIVNAPYRDIAQPIGDTIDWRDLRPAAPTVQALTSAAYLRQWRARFDYVLLFDADKASGPIPEGLEPVRMTPYAALYRIQGHSGPDADSSPQH